MNWKDLFKRGLQDQRNLLQEIYVNAPQDESVSGDWTVAKGGMCLPFLIYENLHRLRLPQMIDIVMMEGRPCKVVDKQRTPTAPPQPDQISN